MKKKKKKKKTIYIYIYILLNTILVIMPIFVTVIHKNNKITYKIFYVSIDSHQ